MELKKGETIMIDVALHLPAACLHEAFSNRSGLPPDHFELYYRGKRLEGEAALSSCGIEKDSAIEVKMRGRGGGNKTDKDGQQREASSSGASSSGASSSGEFRVQGASSLGEPRVQDASSSDASSPSKHDATAKLSSNIEASDEAAMETAELRSANDAGVVQVQHAKKAQSMSPEGGRLGHRRPTAADGGSSSSDSKRVGVARQLQLAVQVCTA